MERGSEYVPLWPTAAPLPQPDAVRRLSRVGRYPGRASHDRPQSPDQSSGRGRGRARPASTGFAPTWSSTAGAASTPPSPSTTAVASAWCARDWPCGAGSSTTRLRAIADATPGPVRGLPQLHPVPRPRRPGARDLCRADGHCTACTSNASRPSGGRRCL